MKKKNESNEDNSIYYSINKGKVIKKTKQLNENTDKSFNSSDYNTLQSTPEMKKVI